MTYISSVHSILQAAVVVAAAATQTKVTRVHQITDNMICPVTSDIQQMIAWFTDLCLIQLVLIIFTLNYIITKPLIYCVI